MDIYLVNSGACDFYQPSTPLRNALYRNNRDGTFCRCYVERLELPGMPMGWALLLAITTARRFCQ